MVLKCVKSVKYNVMCVRKLVYFKRVIFSFDIPHRNDFIMTHNMPHIMSWYFVTLVLFAEYVE